MAMLAGRERIEGIQQIEVAWSRVPGAESTRLHTAHPKPVPLLLVHSLAHSPYHPTFFLCRLFDSPSCPPAHTHPRYPFPLIPFLTVVSSLLFASLLFSSLLFPPLSSSFRAARSSPSSVSFPSEDFRYRWSGRCAVSLSVHPSCTALPFRGRCRFFPVSCLFSLVRCIA